MSEGDSSPKHLDRDVPCRRCGYNLRGLPELGRCPECHAPVILALLPPEIPVIDPQWVERIARGCRIATKALFSGIAVGALSEAFGFVSPKMAVPLGTLVATVSLAVVIYGLWLATESCPDSLDTDSALSVRKFARIALVVWPITMLVAAWVVRTQGGAAGLIPLAIGSPIGLVGVSGAWCFCVHLQRIAERIGDALTRGRALVYRICFATSWFLLVVGTIGDRLTGKMPFIGGWLVGGLGVASFGFLTLGLASYLSDFLPEYLEATKANWEKAETEARSYNSPLEPPSH